MARVIIAALLFLVRPAFAAEPQPVSLPQADVATQEEDHSEAYATVAITAALIASAIMYATNDRSGLVESRPTRSWKFFIDHDARVGITIDF